MEHIDHGYNKKNIGSYVTLKKITKIFQFI